jgi:hypothetical protein
VIQKNFRPSASHWKEKEVTEKNRNTFGQGTKERENRTVKKKKNTRELSFPKEKTELGYYLSLLPPANFLLLSGQTKEMKRKSGYWWPPKSSWEGKRKLILNPYQGNPEKSHTFFPQYRKKERNKVFFPPEDYVRPSFFLKKKTKSNVNPTAGVRICKAILKSKENLTY